MIEPTPDRAEPTGCTLGDLMALTLGVAVAASLDWYSLTVNANRIGMTLAPGWYSLANQGIELIQKGCVALVPVNLARRWRYGGPLRPVEILPTMTATFLVALSLSRWPVFDLYFVWPTPPFHTSVHIEAYRVWELSEFSIGALAALVIFLRRRRAVDWTQGFLLAVAWQLLTTWLGFFYQEWANQQIMIMMPSPVYVSPSSTFLVTWPQLLLAYLPMMIAILDLTLPPRGRRTWVVWAAVVIALPIPFLYEARNLTRIALIADYSLFNAISLVGRITALGASFALARWSEPAWRRILYGSVVQPASEPRS